MQESRQALVSGSEALAAQHRETEMSEDDIKALLDRWLHALGRHYQVTGLQLLTS